MVVSVPTEASRAEATPAYEAPTVNGPTVERVWTTIAVEVAGRPVPDEAGGQHLEREAWFAWERDARVWCDVQQMEGFEASYCPLATGRYHGASDSPSNAWSARATRKVEL